MSGRSSRSAWSAVLSTGRITAVLTAGRIMPDLGWHVIAGEDLLAALRRCAAGESPDLVYAELWANADHERIEGND